MSIFVCIPTLRDIDARTTEAAFSICATHPVGAEFRMVQAQPVDYSRNLCVKLFLETQHSHLFFIDSDVVPPNDCLNLMLAARHPIVCGVYPLLLNQATVCTSVAMKKGENNYEFMGEIGDQPFEVDAGGMGCCLIERQILERMEYPWFRFLHRPDCALTGEDIYFFEQAAKLGIRPLVIPQIQCSHIKTIDLLDVIRAVWKARAPQPQAACV